MSKHVFNAEIQQLLDIVIHSLYSKKEIFLRELVSNASDAMDKRKFLSLTQPDLANSEEYKIILSPDPKEKVLKIIDNGIGMNPEEVIEFIGTIAKSGTKKFSQMSQDIQKTPELIGQFGVGFYSAFMVADKVQLHTQKAGSTEGLLWESQGQGDYTTQSVPRPEGAGTTILLHLKSFSEEENISDFSDVFVLKNLVKKYSDFISYPIFLRQPEKEDEVINSQKAIWMKSPSEVTPEEHSEFYKHISHDWQEPLKHIHWKAEGSLEFTNLIYIPAKKPWNYHYKDFDFGLSLYIKKVFIMDNSKDLLPAFLRFIKGLTDCADLPLNVSREMLQHDRQIQVIKKNLTNKILSTLKEMLNSERPQYEAFFTEFGSTLKEGIAFEPTHKDKIAELLLFKSTASTPENKWVSLDDYIARKKETQKVIYYIIGDSIERIQNSPYLEKLKEKGLEVLLLADPVDEWVMRDLTTYKEISFQAINQDGLDLDTEEEKAAQQSEWDQYQKQYETLLGHLKSTLSEKIKDIKLSKRLTQSPSCVVIEQGDMSPHMQKILAQMSPDSNGLGGTDTKYVLELNPKHPLTQKMLDLKPESQTSWAEMLYYQALIHEGITLKDPHHYSNLVSQAILG